MKTVNLTIALALAAWLPASQVHAISWSEGCSYQAQEQFKALQAKRAASAAVQTNFGEGKQTAAAQKPSYQELRKAKVKLIKTRKEMAQVKQQIKFREDYFVDLRDEEVYFPEDTARGQKIRETKQRVQQELDQLRQEETSLDEEIQKQQAIIEAAKPKRKTSVVPTPSTKTNSKPMPREADYECVGRHRSAGASGSSGSTSSSNDTLGSSGFSSFHPDECRTGR